MERDKKLEQMVSYFLLHLFVLFASLKERFSGATGLKDVGSVKV